MLQPGHRLGTTLQQGCEQPCDNLKTEQRHPSNWHCNTPETRLSPPGDTIYNLVGYKLVNLVNHLLHMQPSWQRNEWRTINQITQLMRWMRCDFIYKYISMHDWIDTTGCTFFMVSLFISIYSIAISPCAYNWRRYHWWHPQVRTCLLQDT